jgi:hypothetical protein
MNNEKESAKKDSETEDSFRKNYEPQLDGISRKAKHAFQFSENGPFEPWHQTEIRIPLQSLKAVTKAHGATITEYVVSLYLDILRKAAGDSRKPIVPCDAGRIAGQSH